MDEESVSLSEYRGRPVVLVTLAVHCRHSYDTLPIIESLKREYEPRVAVLPVYVNVTARRRSGVDRIAGPGFSAARLARADAR